MNQDDKKAIIQDLNVKIGSDINDITSAYELENALITKRDRLKNVLSVANDDVPTKIFSVIEKAENDTTQIEKLKHKSEECKKKVDSFLNRIEPLRTELDQRFTAINKLQAVLGYLKSYEKIDLLSQQMSNSNDDEQTVALYGELKSKCIEYQNGHRGNYVKEYTHYWHTVLKEKLTKQYEEVLKLMKWPIASGAENSPPPKEIIFKFTNLTRYLFLIEEPDIAGSTTSDSDQDTCLPVKILLRPLKKRFIFHFTGPRQTARIDRPEWFLTQTLTWIKDHQGFVQRHIQPIADKLQLKKVKAVDEFNAGLISLAAERLHTVLGLYHTQGAKGTLVDEDAAFAHAVDETLGFHRELLAITGKEVNNILSVLTKAEIFVRWLAVEKKYALLKMDESLENEQWSEPVGAGVGAAVGSAVWVPRGADWFIALLKTIEERYAVLPQPGHRLQFVEVQLELVEEWRVRLTQLANATRGALLTAALNAAHHTRTVLLQWAHSLHYLQLHYYRRQFQHFTQQQHHEVTDPTLSSNDDDDDDSEESEETTMKSGIDMEDARSLEEVEIRAKKLALNEVSRQNSTTINDTQYDNWSLAPKMSGVEWSRVEGGAGAIEEAGVFGDAPALLAHLRDQGLAALAHHILLDFKDNLRDYKREKWHSMSMVEEQALCVSGSLCAPLGALCARAASAARSLAPALALSLHAHLATHIDEYIYEEIVLECWFNTGGTIQFTHDVKRNIVPAFAQPDVVVSRGAQFPKLVDACKLLNMDYDDARRLRALLSNQLAIGGESLKSQGIRHVNPEHALQILNHRTDLSDSSRRTHSSVMEMF